MLGILIQRFEIESFSSLKEFLGMKYEILEDEVKCILIKKSDLKMDFNAKILQWSEIDQ